MRTIIILIIIYLIHLGLTFYPNESESVIYLRGLTLGAFGAMFFTVMALRDKL